MRIGPLKRCNYLVRAHLMVKVYLSDLYFSRPDAGLDLLRIKLASLEEMTEGAFEEEREDIVLQCGRERVGRWNAPAREKGGQVGRKHCRRSPFPRERRRDSEAHLRLYARNAGARQ